MVDKLTTPAERLKYLRKESGMSLAAVGRQLGVSPQAVHKWENGGKIDDARQFDLASLFRASPGWLFWGEYERDSFHIPNTPDTGFPSKPIIPENGIFVPLLTPENVASWLNGPHTHLDFHDGDWIACPGGHGERTFAMQIKGVSMESLGQRLSFSDGDVVFIDPEIQPQSGDCVALHKAGLEEEWIAVIRQLIIEDKVRYERPLNPAWPEQIRNIYEARVFGPVIGKWSPMK
jgi:transcriptional regulator with XRE-family HTH domain